MSVDNAPAMHEGLPLTREIGRGGVREEACR